MAGPAGYVANAITRSGGDAVSWHVYFYLENDVLNANSFQQNLIGAPRTPDKQIEPGYFVGGPILKNRLFFSSAFEHLRSHSFQGPATLSASLHEFLVPFPTQNTAARQAAQYVPAAGGYGWGQPLATLTVSPPVASRPVTRNRTAGLHHARADETASWRAASS